MVDRYHSLYKYNFKEIFSQAIGAQKEDVKIMNDAVCFLQGEVFSGSGHGFQSSIGVTLGLGLGSAIYQNNKVTDADLHSMPFLEGEAEDYISIRWLLARFNQITGILAKDLSEVRQLADTNPAVEQIFDEFSTSLSKFLEAFIKQTNPEVVVVGGFMELYNRFFFDSLSAKAQNMGIKTPILRAILGEQASIVGAASSWYSESPIHT
jgi:glucokinase